MVERGHELQLIKEPCAIEIVKTARSILEYTGLTGDALETRTKEFSRYNRGKGLYTENDIIKKSGLINDPVFGAIKLHPLIDKIINTPEFYRLKNVKKLGGVCHVYPGANHTRFEHSLGVSYIAGEFICHLRDQHPTESNIQQQDILCVNVAGLCYNLGQGPYSHVFEERVVTKIIEESKIPERWCAKLSVLIFRKILQQRMKVLSSFVRSRLCKLDVQFIEEMIEHDEDDFIPEGRKDDEQRFLYEIVINRKTGIDASKWDSLVRDCHYLGITVNFQLRRLIELSYIVGGKGDKKRHIGFRNKEVNSILEMFHMQCSLNRKAYKHKTVHAVEMMIAEVILLCKDIELLQLQPEHDTFELDDETPDSKLGKSILEVEVVSINEAVESSLRALDNNCIEDLQGYLALNDFILDQITHMSVHDRQKMHQHNPKWNNFVKAHELLWRIEHRELYKLAACKYFSTERKEVSNDKAMRVKRLQDLLKEDKPRVGIAKCSPDISQEDIHVELVTVSMFGSGEPTDQDPLKNVSFVPKDDLSKPNPNELEKASPLVRPEEFVEYQLRVYSQQRKKKVVKKAFQAWYDSGHDLNDKSVLRNKFPHEIIGEVERFDCGPEGCSFMLEKHGIKISFPPGAIKKTVEVELAVCLDGPFIFPNNKRPVSPILWICTSGSVKEFNKPIDVIIPHIFPELPEQDRRELEIQFAKADHCADLDGLYEYTFKEIKESHYHIYGGHGVLSLNHCCYLCVLVNNEDRAIATNAGCCMSCYTSTIGCRNIVTFCATYFLESCLEALNNQFPPETYTRLNSPKNFKFHEGEDQHLLVQFESTADRRIVSADPTECKIFATEIDFWKRAADGQNLCLLHKYQMYPPRVKFEVNCDSSEAFKLMFRFTGCPSSEKLNVDVMFPLACTQVSHTTIKAPTFDLIHLMNLEWNEGQTRQSYSIVSLIQDKWKTVAEALGIDPSTIDTLERTPDQLQNTCRFTAIIQVWLTKRAGPNYPPNWKGLYDLLKHIRAEEVARDMSRILLQHFQYDVTR